MGDWIQGAILVRGPWSVVRCSLRGLTSLVRERPGTPRGLRRRTDAGAPTTDHGPRTTGKES